MKLKDSILQKKKKLKLNFGHRDKETLVDI